MRILHLIIDHQVIERTLGVYEKVFPQCNDVVVFSQTGEYKHLTRYAQSPRIEPRTSKRSGQNFDFTPYQYVVAHYLTFEMIEFIMSVPKDIHVCWEIYGYDLYNQFLEPLGYKLQQVDERKYDSLKVRFLKRLGIDGLYLWLRSGNGVRFAPVRNKAFRKITKRINSVAVCCSGDAKVLEKYSGRRVPVYKSNNYSLHETLGDLYGKPFNQGGGILIGNSASLTNNHLYVLDIIKNYNIDKQFVIPLSYGGVVPYKADVMTEYKKLYYKQTCFLLEYLPLHEYNNIFLEIGVMVLASWRQESIGTTMMGFYLGIKIYMSNRSPLYHSFKEEGFVVFEIESTNAVEFNTPLTLEQKEHNRALLLERYSESSFEGELKKQFT